MLLRDKSYWNLGSSKIKTFIFLVILAVVVYVAYIFGITYYDHWSLGEDLDQQLGLYNTWRGALNSTKPTQQGIRDNAKKQATEMGFTFEDKDFKIMQDSNDKLSCEIKYKKKLNFFVYEYEMEFEHAYSPKDFIGKKVTEIL